MENTFGLVRFEDTVHGGVVGDVCGLEGDMLAADGFEAFDDFDRAIVEVVYDDDVVAVLY